MSKKMGKLQVRLLLLWVMLTIITVRAFSEMGLLQAAAAFYRDLQYGWRAQFNFDFQIYLAITALWVFYREENFIRSCLFSLLALLAGNLFFAPYLAYLIYNTKGDTKQILLGKHNL